MKNTIILFITVVLIPIFGASQPIENLDYISSFHDEVAAIKKDNYWAFINRDGDIVVNFRNDLVTTKTNDGNYPIFKNGRCLIVKEKDDISYFGYINTTGETVVKPQYLNASNFNNNIAIVLELIKEDVGKNVALGKNVVYYKYYEVTIDINGNTKHYLTQEGINVVLDKKFLRKSPEITSKLISDNLVAFKGKNKKWLVKKIN